MEAIGFEVIRPQSDDDEHGGCTTINVRNLLAQLDQKSRQADIALFFFAGHGLEIDGQNYLIATDTKLDNKADVLYGSVPLEDVGRSISKATFRLTILDCCRNNPFRAQHRGSGWGNAQLALPEFSDVEAYAFAAKAGETAKDGKRGENSPYSASLAKRLREPVELLTLFRSVARDVRTATDNDQKPSLYVDAPDEIYLNHPNGPDSIDNLPKQRGGAYSIAGPGSSGTVDTYTPGRGQTEWLADSLGKTIEAPDMVLVPAGKFRRPPADAKRNKWVDVTISQPFLISRFPITFSQWSFAQQDADWLRLTGLRPVSTPTRSDNEPVTHVSWEHAKAYTKWLSGKTSFLYRLPSECEWEHACRAGADTIYPWGDAISPKKAFYGAKNKQASPKPVGEYEPNDWGLYQMCGNVWEWVEDSWHRDSDECPTDGSPYVSDEVKTRVLKGGCRFSSADELIFSARKEAALDQQFSDRSFRIVCNLTGRP